MLPGESVTYLSADSVNCDNNEEAQNYPREFLNSLTPSGMLYMAFSRERALGDVRVKVKDTNQQGKMQANIVTKNIVCREVLS